jgi:hypothetical protein
LSDGGFLRDQPLDQDGGALLLRVRVLNAQLTLSVGTHGIDQRLRCNKERVRGATGHLDDGDVIRTEPRDRMNLSLSADLLAEAELAEPIAAPREDFGEILFDRGLFQLNATFDLLSKHA